MDGCYDMFIKTVSTQNSTIINHNGNYYRVIFVFMSKKDASNLIKNTVILGEKEILFIFAFMSKKDASNLIKNTVILGEKETFRNLLFMYNLKK